MVEPPFDAEHLAPAPTGGLQPLTIDSSGVMNWAATAGVAVPAHTHDGSAGSGGQLTPASALTPITGTGAAVLQSNPEIISPQINQIDTIGAPGLPIVVFAASSATPENYIGLVAKDSGTNPVISVESTSDANRGLNVTTQGTGTLQQNGVDVDTISAAYTLTNKTLVTPTIASFTNAQHNHTNAAGGGTLGAAAFSSMTSAELRGIISDETGTGLAVFNDSPEFTTEITTPSVHILSSASAFDIYLETSEVLTADRRLRLVVSDANRVLTMTASTTLAGGTHSGTNTGDQTITLTGDVTGTGTGSFAATIANDAVTYAKMQNVSATDRLLGRSTAGAGDVEEITCTSFARSLLDDSTAAAALATLGLTQLMDTSGRCVRSTLPNANTGFTMTSGTAYFVYLGRVLVTSTFAFVRFACRTGGTGAQTAEVGFFSSSTAPSRANQSLTKLAATGTVDDLTTTGVKGNTATLAISVAAGTHLWAGIRTAMATTQPSLYGLIADRSHGRVLSTAAAGALTGAGPWTGALITDAGTTLAPDLEGALD